MLDMTIEELNPIQVEIEKVLEQFKEKTTFTEAVLAKKLRENTKLEGKQKAGIGMNDLEKATLFAGEERSIFYSLHLNSANDLLIKKADATELLSADARKRRQSSERSMSILTSSDLKSPKQGNNKSKGKRTDRKHINVNSNFEELDY